MMPRGTETHAHHQHNGVLKVPTTVQHLSSVSFRPGMLSRLADLVCPDDRIPLVLCDEPGHVGCMARHGEANADISCFALASRLRSTMLCKPAMAWRDGLRLAGEGDELGLAETRLG